MGQEQLEEVLELHRSRGNNTCNILRRLVVQYARNGNVDKAEETVKVSRGDWCVSWEARIYTHAHTHTHTCIHTDTHGRH